MEYCEPILALLFIIAASEACNPVYHYSPGGPPREADYNPYWNWNYPPPSGWHEDNQWPQSPYRIMDYVYFMREYKRKLQEAKDRSIKQAQEAAAETGDSFSVPDPNNPNNMNPGDIFGPNGPFGGGSFGFPPEGDGGIGDKGRYGHDGRFRPVKKGDRQPYLPYGPYAKYPKAWGAAGIRPADAIHDGVPTDVDEDWPDTWKGIGLPDTGDEPPPMAKDHNTYGIYYNCNEKPVRGDCWDRQLRWAYDSYWQNCYSFIWGGCGGNRNNFITYTECWEKCGRGSQYRQCKHANAFVDYTEWPDKDLYTSERAPSGRRSRRINMNDNNTQSLLQQIIINKQPAREIIATPKITLNKQQLQYQEKESVNTGKQITKTTTIEFLSNIVKNPKNTSDELNVKRNVTKTKVLSNFFENNKIINNSKHADIETFNINNTFSNNHDNVTISDSNKIPTSEHTDVATSAINNSFVNNHTSITSFNINKNLAHDTSNLSTSIDTDIVVSNINKNSSYNRPNIIFSYTNTNPINNYNAIATSHITKTSVHNHTGITSYNINKNITNNNTIGNTISNTNNTSVNNRNDSLTH